ncbi:MAG: hypothetical protein L0Z51_02550 [Candidatus Latescibacteria bacterium]|nr:hypothetical protein [Candidatus Latescibacterota bacterium]
MADRVHGSALVAITILLYRLRHSDFPVRRRVLAAMNLFFGVTIGIMAFGHLLAVTTKLALGTLAGSLLVFYGIGTVLAVPAWWLVLCTCGVLVAERDHGDTTLVLNAWLAIALIALGLHNLPMAAPALLSIGYQLHSRRLVRWAIVVVAVVVNVGLFVGSLVFMASGQSFEQFRGIE